MLHQGAALQDIAAILRRHSIKTMQIYAKVHVDLLQEIPHPPPRAPLRLAGRVTPVKRLTTMTAAILLVLLC